MNWWSFLLSYKENVPRTFSRVMLAWSRNILEFYNSFLQQSVAMVEYMIDFEYQWTTKIYQYVNSS